MDPTQELYDVLRRAYEHFNKALFESQLPDVIFTVQRRVGVLGYFAAERWGDSAGNKCGELAINPAYLANSRLIEVMQTLVHEMVHCWQHEFGNPGRSYYHNLEWARKMISVGLMPSDTGQPGGDITGQAMGDYILEDGRFLVAYEALLAKEDFALKWVDRNALPRLYEPVIATLASNNQASPKPQLSELHPALARIEPPVDPTPAPIPAEERAASDQLPDSFWIPPPIRKKNTRTQYICPGCYAKVYGRAGLTLRCEDCDATLKSSSPETD